MASVAVAVAVSTFPSTCTQPPHPQADAAKKNASDLKGMIKLLATTRKNHKLLMEKLGEVVATCEAKVQEVKDAIEEAKRVRKDKSNPKYMRERAKDDRRREWHLGVEEGRKLREERERKRVVPNPTALTLTATAHTNYTARSTSHVRIAEMP